MGNVIPCSLKTTHTIAERWSTPIRDLPVEEKTELIVQLLDSVVNGYHCGLSQKFDYVFLRCEEPITTELCQALQAKPELRELRIKVDDHNGTTCYNGGWKDNISHGIEIRPEPTIVDTTLAKSLISTEESTEESTANCIDSTENTDEVTWTGSCSVASITSGVCIENIERGLYISV